MADFPTHWRKRPCNGSRALAKQQRNGCLGHQQAHEHHRLRSFEPSNLVECSPDIGAAWLHQCGPGKHCRHCQSPRRQQACDLTVHPDKAGPARSKTALLAADLMNHQLACRLARHTARKATRLRLQMAVVEAPLAMDHGAHLVEMPGLSCHEVRPAMPHLAPGASGQRHAKLFPDAYPGQCPELRHS